MNKEQEFARRDVRQEVTNTIIQALENGVMPWRKPWRDAHDVPDLLPRNGDTGHVYRGGNRAWLMSVMSWKGYDDPRFMTFKQLEKWDAAPAKGQKGYPIEYWDRMPFWKRKDLEITLNGAAAKVVDVDKSQLVDVAKLADGQQVPVNALAVRSPEGKLMSWFAAEKTLDVYFSRYAVVFNVQQCNGIERFLAERPLAGRKMSDVELDETLEKVMQGMQKTGVSVRHEPRNRAYYSPALDTVVMPTREQFHDAAGYRSTLLHELGHATGHESRLNRTFGEEFGSPEYAREELVAELTSAFMMAETGIVRDDNQHAAYIGSWLQVLKAPTGKHAIFEAAREAERAANYMLERAGLTREMSAQEHAQAQIKQTTRARGDVALER